jgi:hypothetical protein
MPLIVVTREALSLRTRDLSIVAVHDSGAAALTV